MALTDGINQIKRYVFTIFNYLGLKIAYKLNWTKFPLLPVSIDIEPINTCNFKCPHCQVTHWSKEKKILNEFSLDKIIKQFPNLYKIKLQGMGEPLMNSNFIPMLKLGERYGILMSFFSNASLCNQKTAEELVKLKKTEIIFSLDGSTAETFEKIRKGSRFELVIQNIANLVKLFKSLTTHKLPVSVWTVITKDNISEIPQIVKLASELGVNKVVLQTALTNWGQDEMKKHTDPLKINHNSENFPNLLKESQKIAKDKHLELCITGENTYSKHSKCPWPWKHTYICANGDVVPCCKIANSDIVKMGNVFEQDFTEIWNSQQYQELRQRISNHDLPNYCKNCYVDAE